MEIIAKSVHIIDYEDDAISAISPPEAFEEYVSALITEISADKNIREYQTVSKTSEVIACILHIQKHLAPDKKFEEQLDAIAYRLLRKEKDAQQRIEQLPVRVQKGSLIQALLHEDSGNFSYLLAKVEHTSFVDDLDFSFKTGFSKDKKTIWKTCVFDLSNIEADQISAHIYSNTRAKYWSDDFLELVPIKSDEENTRVAFKAIDIALNNIIKNNAPYDHTILRNSFICYFKTHTHMNYDAMLEDIILPYTPFQLASDKFERFKEALNELPEKRNFDRQFTPIAKEITGRIKKVFPIREGIELSIKDGISNLERVITADHDHDGSPYLKILIDDESTFRRFFKGE